MRKTAVKFMSVFFPNWVVNMAYKALTNPQMAKIREHETLTLNKAHQETIEFEGFQIQTYTWLGGKDAVLLVHGWEGQAGNFADLTEQLITENYTVYAFDAPSHGNSSKGQTSLFEFSELVGLLIQKFNVTKIVSHSFGSVATSYILHKYPHLKIEKYVMLTTPDKFLERIEDVANKVGVSEKIKNKLIVKLENAIHIKVQDFNVSDFVKKIQVENALIIHDKADRIIPIEQARKVHQNWKNATIDEIENTGHFKILRSTNVIKKIINFLKP